MSTLQALLGRFDINVDNQSYSLDTTAPVGDNPLTVAAGKFFVAGHTGEADTNNLAATMTTQIQALGGVYAGATVTLSLADGLVRIGEFGAAVDITWTDTNLQDLLGFTGAQTGAISYTGTNPARYLWRPNKGLADHPIDLISVVAPSSSTMVSATRDGTIMTARQTTVFAGELEWQLMQESDAIIPSTGTSVNREFATFFEDIIAAGERVRIVYDRTSYAATTDYVTVTVFPGDDIEPQSIGPIQDYLERGVDGNLALWNVRLFARKHI